MIRKMTGKGDEPVKKKLGETYEKFLAVRSKVGKVLRTVGQVLFHSRKLVLTVPVVLLGWKVLGYAREHLPEDVGILLKESGDFHYIISKSTALSCCLGITGFCLLMMILSRKTVYPWIITMFTLVLPLFLVVTNIFPG